MAVEVGQVIGGKYKLLRLLGDGGMGSVYEAEHTRLGTHVAVKILHGDLARRAGLMDRFLQEAKVSAQIRSPHVVHVTDVDGTPEGVAYLVMELLQGEPLSNVVRREKKLPTGTACEYTMQILQALEAAHALGVIHRDLKPDNVFVTFEGGKPVLKLIDFGIAKLKRDESAQGTTKNLTVAGMLMGTPEYMAPEQAYSADKVDVRADLYSVGVMMYEMLSGALPVEGGDPRIVVTKVERGEVTPLVNVAPGVPPAIAGFVHKAMAPTPAARFISATEMREELAKRMHGGGGIQQSTAPLPQVQAKLGSDRPAPLVSQVSGIPVDIGTGTVMGAPAPGALGPPADLATSAPAGGGGGTVRGAPIAQPQPPPPIAYEPSRLPQAERRSGGGGKGLIIALALIATLLGAGAVVAYVMSTQEPTPVGPVVPITTDTTTPTAPTTVATATTPPTVTTTTPLTPGPQVQPPPPHSGGTTPPRPSASTAPSGSGTQPNGPPPFVIPSGFPSAIPLPSGFPSAFPLPSGFPSAFPWPPPPAPRGS